MAGLRSIADNVTRVCRSLDRASSETNAFDRRTGLSCPTGCGLCCENPRVEASVLELLPLAVALKERGELGYWLAVPDTKEHCRFFAKDPSGPGRGRCSVYELRPSLCRVYGAATVPLKRGGRELVVCPQRREAAPDLAERAEAFVEAGGVAPSFPDFRRELVGIDAKLAATLPMSAAFEKAAELLLNGD